jgi:polysaccharide biosynthesis/export protein
MRIVPVVTAVITGSKLRAAAIVQILLVGIDNKSQRGTPSYAFLAGNSQLCTEADRMKTSFTKFSLRGWAATPLSMLAMTALLPLLLLLTGCAGGGGGFTIFSPGSYLIPTARTMADSSPNPAPLPRELQMSVIPDYYIQPGDVLLIEPTAFDTPIRIPADQTVLPDGTVDLGKYGRIVVAGLTVDAIEDVVMQVVRAEEGEVDPINVRLIDPRSMVYYVLGEVNAPGTYPLIGRETVLDVINNAGGLTDNASPCEIILARPTHPNSCRVVLSICYNEIVQLGDTGTNYQIMPGDRVFVGSKTLCERLRFWRKECDRCRNVQCPCPHPGVVTYESPFILPLHYGDAEPTPAAVVENRRPLP